MPVKKPGSKTIDFGGMYAQLVELQDALGLSSFSELIRHICVDYLERRRTAAAAPAPSG